MIPTGFKEVTKDEFFAELYKDKRDIMPRNDRNQTFWETQNRVVWGWTSQGWKPTREKEIFALKF